MVKERKLKKNEIMRVLSKSISMYFYVVDLSSNKLQFIVTIIVPTLYLFCISLFKWFHDSNLHKLNWIEYIKFILWNFIWNKFKNKNT